MGLAIGMPDYYWDEQEIIARNDPSVQTMKVQRMLCHELADCLYPQMCKRDDVDWYDPDGWQYRFWIGPQGESGACMNDVCYNCRYRPIEAVDKQCPAVQAKAGSDDFLPDGGKFRCYWGNLMLESAGKARYEGRDCAEFEVIRRGNHYIEYSFGNVPC